MKLWRRIKNLWRISGYAAFAPYDDRHVSWGEMDEAMKIVREKQPNKMATIVDLSAKDEFAPEDDVHSDTQTS